MCVSRKKNPHGFFSSISSNSHFLIVREDEAEEEKKSKEHNAESDTKKLLKIFR